MKYLIITALREESRLIRQIDTPISERRLTPKSRFYELRSGNYLYQGGMGLARMGESLAALPVDLSVAAVLIIGVSGSVSETLEIGAFIQPDRYFGPDNQEIDPAPWAPPWLETLHSRQHVVKAPLLSCIEPVATAEDRLAAAETGALAVDMESFEVARFCTERNLPLLTLRIISDLAGDGAFEEFKKNFTKVAAHLQELLIPYLYPQHAD